MTTRIILFIRSLALSLGVCPTHYVGVRMFGTFSVDRKGVCYPWVDTRNKAIVGPIFSIVKGHLIFSVDFTDKELGEMAIERTYAYLQVTKES